MPEERNDGDQRLGTHPPHSKGVSGKYYDIATTLFSTGRSGELVDLFIAAARDGDYNRIENLLQRRGDAVVSVDVKDKRTGNTPLIWAAKRGHTKIVQLLLKHGADVTLKNYEGHTAVEAASPGLKTLLLDSVGHSGLSVHQRLLQAAWQGNANMVSQLLSESRTLDIDCQNGDGLTPLLLLCRDLQLFERLSSQLRRDYDPLQVLSILLEHRANIHATDNDGKSCLHYVSQSRAKSTKLLVEELLHHGSQTDLRDRQCFTPIHCASQMGNVDVIHSLIDGGSEVNVRGFAGATPLHYTAYNDNDQAAATLLDHGADILLTDDQGFTALDVAKSKKMKSRLREAWTEAAQGRQEVNLAPVRAPSRDGSRLSMRGNTPDHRPRGEVLFDGLPLNPFSNSLTHSKVKLLKPRSPLEKACLAEEQMLANLESSPLTTSRDGIRRLGIRRQTGISKSTLFPQSSRSSERLPPVNGELGDCIITKSRSRPGVHYQRSLTDLSKSTKTNKLAKLYTYPRVDSRKGTLNLTRDSPISVRRLATDLDDDYRLRRLSTTPGRQTPGRTTPSMLITSTRSPNCLPPHRRSHSDSSPNLGQLTHTCNDYLHTARRRCLSTPSCAASEDFDTEEEELRFSPRPSLCQIMSPGSVSNVRVNVPQTIDETRSSTLLAKSLPTLAQMRLTKSCTPVQPVAIFPNSRKLLPPSPIQKSLSNLERSVTRDTKDISPRSSCEFDEGISLTSDGKVIQLERRRTLLKSEFIIEESRPKDLLLQSSGSDSCDSVECNPVNNVNAFNGNQVNSANARECALVSQDSFADHKAGNHDQTSAKKTINKSPVLSKSLNIKQDDQNSLRPMSNTEKLQAAAKENGQIDTTTVVPGHNEPVGRKDSVPNQSLSKRASVQNEPVKVADNNNPQKPNSGSRKTLTVQPTKLISSMKKRAILRTKQSGQSEGVRSSVPGRLPTDKVKAPVLSNSPKKTLSVSDNKTSATSRSEANNKLTNPKEIVCQTKNVPETLPSVTPTICSASALTTSVTTSTVSQADKMCVSSTSSCTENKSKSDWRNSTEMVGKTPLVKIFSNPSEARLSEVRMEALKIQQTPLIVNPFEDFFSEVSGAIGNNNMNSQKHNANASKQRAGSASSKKPQVKSVKNAKPVTQKGKQPTPSTSKKRVSSGRKRGTAKPADDKRPQSNTRSKTTGKSNRRVRSGKVRGKMSEKENLGDDAAKSDVALISGIGWHIATTCDDKSDIHAVKLDLHSDSSDDEDLDKVQLCTPRFNGLRPFSSPSPRFVEVKTDTNQADVSQDIPPINLDMTRNTINHHGVSHSWEYNLADVEVVVHPASDNSQSSGNVLDSCQEFHLNLSQELILSKLSPIPESPLLSGTTSALENFSRQVTDDMFEEMLGGNSESIANLADLRMTNKDLNSDSDSDDTLVSSRSQPCEDNTNIEVELTRTSVSQESKFIEMKKANDVEDYELDEIVEEILSSTGPLSLNSTRRSNKSTSSRNSTLTEGDLKMLKTLQNTDSPFHAKAKHPDTEGVRESAEMEEHLGTNPDLLRVFHAEDFKLGQKMKAMIDAGAESSRVEAMLQVESEAKHLERIIHSFKKMELVAHPNQEVVDGPRVSNQSPHRGRSSTLENPRHRRVNALPGRPHSAAGMTSASKARRGRFTEIKEDSNSKNFKAVADHHSKGEKPEEAAHPSQTENQYPVQNDSSLKQTEYDSQDTAQRSSSACSSSSAHSIPISEEDTVCWKKGNILGRGAFGTVWCGLTGEGELIAVKQIELTTNDMKKAKREYEKIQEEVELLKTLTHKNIVGYLGTSFENNFVSIYMQFVPGGSIASILARFGALEERVFCLYTKQILQGVEYLHDNDVIHRDIKGGNIMLMPTGVIKLIDFGCAKRLCINLSMSRSQILKSMKGTPYWMSPEVVNETGHGKKSDIWSIGCTVFEMATRKPPWSEMSPIAAIFAIGCDKPIPELPEKFSKDVRDFVSKCLTRDQTARMSASEALQHRFITRRRKSRAM